MATHDHASHKWGLPIVALGTIGMGLSWVLTPSYGPWVCNAVTAIPVLFAAFVWGDTSRNLRLSSRAFASSVAVGLTITLFSWLVAPVVVRSVPSFGTAMQRLYATLDRPPGPLRALPILLLTAAAEEVVWRGELVTWLRKRVSRSATVVIATLSYVLPIAASQSMLLLIVAIGLGAGLTLLRLFTKSWVGPFVAHSIWALGVFVVHPISS